VAFGAWLVPAGIHFADPTAAGHSCAASHVLEALFLGECKLDPAIVDTGDGQFGDKFVTPRTLAAALGALVAAGLNLALPHPLPAASSCCNLFSLLADGGSTTVVAGGVHLLHCCHCCVISFHTYATVTAEETPRRSESKTIAAVHGNRECPCPVFWTRSFLLTRICPHQPLQTPLRCTTLRAALLVFSSFHYFIELGGDLTASSIFTTLRGFAFSLVCGHRLC